MIGWIRRRRQERQRRVQQSVVTRQFIPYEGEPDVLTPLLIASMMEQETLAAPGAVYPVQQPREFDGGGFVGGESGGGGATSSWDSGSDSGSSYSDSGSSSSCDSGGGGGCD